MASGGAVGSGGRTVPGTGGAGAGLGTGGTFVGGSGGAPVDGGVDQVLDQALDQPVGEPDTGMPDQPSDGADGVDWGHPTGNPDGSMADGALSTCSGGLPKIDVRLCVLGADGKLVTAGVDVPVTVTQVDDAMMACDPAGIEQAPVLFRRVAVESATGTKWTVLLRIPELPPTQVAAGQTLQMAVTAAPSPAFARTAVNQTIVFARQGSLILFASNLGRVARFTGTPGGSGAVSKFDLLPDLTNWGLGLSDGGATCSTNLITCVNVQHRLGLVWGGTERAVDLSQTAQVGSLSLSLGTFSEMLSQGSCDANSLSRLGGFVAQP